MAGRLERRDLLLDRGAGRVARSRVLVALVHAHLALGERRRQRDRRHDRAGRCVGRLAGVDRQCLERPPRLRLLLTHRCSTVRSAQPRARASKYDRMSVRVSTLSGRPPDKHEQRRRGVQHLQRQLQPLTGTDRRQRRAHHLFDGRLHHRRVAGDRLHQLELVDRSRHLGRRERRRVLAHGQLAHAVGADDVDRGAHGVLGVDVQQRLDRRAARVEDRGHAPVALDEEPVVRHPVVVEHPRQVPASGVGVEHDHDRRRIGGARDADRSGDRQPARPADQDPLGAAHAARGEEALLVADRDHLVVEVGLPRGREEVLADTLDQVRPARPAGEHRALGVGGDDADRRGCAP